MRRALRSARGLSQAQLATLVGAARKAVVYQWKARKRTPSPLFWQRLTALFTTAASPLGNRIVVSQVQRAALIGAVNNAVGSTALRLFPRLK